MKTIAPSLLITTINLQHNKATTQLTNHLHPPNSGPPHQLSNMKATIISSFAVLLALTSAAPTPAPAGGPQASPGTISTLALFGATPEAQYSINVPTTGQITPTGNPLSISHAQNYGSVPCGLLGIDRLLQEIAPGAYIDVGPPQTIFAIACGPKTGQNGW